MEYEDLVKFYGSQGAIAKELGLAQSTVAEWKQIGRVPLGRQFQIELMTKGKLKASRPSIQAHVA